jgi:hypothetical protein
MDTVTSPGLSAPRMRVVTCPTRPTTSSSATASPYLRRSSAAKGIRPDQVRQICPVALLGRESSEAPVGTSRARWRARKCGACDRTTDSQAIAPTPLAPADRSTGGVGRVRPICHPCTQGTANDAGNGPHNARSAATWRRLASTSSNARAKPVLCWSRPPAPRVSNWSRPTR